MKRSGYFPKDPPILHAYPHDDIAAAAHRVASKVETVHIVVLLLLFLLSGGGGG